MPVSVERLEQLLPQTQCRQCGYDGCTPYAEALAQGAAAVNLCAPGGESVMHDLTQVLGLPLQHSTSKPASAETRAIACIDETACIGCTACIRACPVDAIVGATKHMHTVIHDECSGCGLCLPPCPVDCIVMQPVDAAWLPLSRSLVSGKPDERRGAAAQARTRYQHHRQRLARLAAERQAYLVGRRSIPSATADTAPASAAPVNTADWVAKAMNRARALQSQRQEPDNQAAFQQQQIAKAQERATYRRAMRDFQYGNAAEKSAAQAYLRDRKARQEAERSHK